MAIRAPFAPLMARVCEHTLGVTARAFFCGDGWRLVEVMTVSAIRRRMNRDGGRVRFRIRMTRDARRDLLLGGRERMTRHAVGLQRRIALMRV